MDNLILACVSFVAGGLAGFFGRGFFDKMQDKGKADQANTFVLVVVTIIWATSVLIDIASPTYETSPLVHGLMGGIVGFFFRPYKDNEK